MKSLLPILLCVAILSAPVACAKRRGSDADKQQSAAAVPSTRDEQKDSAGQDASGITHDVGTSLDELLSKPITAPTKADQTVLPDVQPDVGHDTAKPSLQGTAVIDSASGEASDASVPGLKAQQPKAAPTVLKGNAALNHLGVDGSDPDAEDRELMVEWDRWRNRFLLAVQHQVQASVNNPDEEEYSRPRIDPITGYVMPRFPLGTEAWFDCEVTSDRRVTKLKITTPSGIPEYDHAIVNGIRALEGTSLLQFPRGSHRTVVRQEAGIKTSNQANYQYYHFGDVERYRAPAAGGY